MVQVEARPAPARRGRAARSRLRQANGSARAVGPGFKGGSFKPLSARDIDRIHETVLDVLEKIGIAEPPPEMIEPALAKGCWLTDDNRICFPRGFVEDTIAGACRSFTIHGRDPAHDVTLGGDKVHFATAGEAVTVYEPKSRSYRPSTLLDLYDMARLCDRLDNIHRFCQTVIATEIEDSARARRSTSPTPWWPELSKSLAVSILGPDDIAAVIALFDVIAGGEGEFRKKRPFCTIGCCPILSPLQVRRGSRARRPSPPCAWACLATSPWRPRPGPPPRRRLAGTLVQVTAETLATVHASPIFSAPGHPTTYAAWPFVSDLRTGAFTGGSGEEALLGAAAVQVGNFYDLPTTVGAGMTDSKLPDGQAGYEKALTNAPRPASLGPTTWANAPACKRASWAAASRRFVIDNDMLGAVARTVRGIEVTEETLSFEVMAEVARGAGHYLGTAQTLALMESEYFYPGLADRSAFGAWEKEGSRDIRETAEARARAILSSHYPSYLDRDLDREIRRRFPILLGPGDMSPASGRW